MSSEGGSSVSNATEETAGGVSFDFENDYCMYNCNVTVSYNFLQSNCLLYSS